MELKINTYGNEKQKEALRVLLDNSNSITDIGYGGGAGGGKSYTGVMWQWIVRNRYPGTRGFFGRKELKRLKQTTLQTYFKFLQDYKIPEAQRGVLNNQEGIIRFKNGSEILLLDMNYQPSDPLYYRFGSLEFTDGFIDEGMEIGSSCIEIIKTRIGRHKNNEYSLLPKLFLTFNPDKGYVYRTYYRPYKDNTLPNDTVFIPALVSDNKKIPQAYIEQLKKLPVGITKERLLYGNFDYDDTPGRLFDYNAILDIFTNSKNNGIKYLTCDVARKGKDKAVIMVWDGLEVTEIITFDICTNDIIEAKIRELQGRHNIGTSNIIVDEDGVGGGIVDHLRCRGFVNNSSALNVNEITKYNDYLKPNYRNLKTQCYFKLAEVINTHKIRVNTSEENIKQAIIQELDVIVEVNLDKDAKKEIISKEELKEKLGRSPDYADCMMMRMWYELFGDTRKRTDMFYGTVRRL